MSESYAREILRRNVAQICQTIGWNGINSAPMDILVNVFERYIRTLGTEASRYAEQFNRTEPNLNDLGLVFRDLNVQLPELQDYTSNVPPVPLPFNVELFPRPRDSNLNFLKPGSHEVVTRPMHVHEHLPPMYPEKEKEALVVAETIEIQQNGIDNPPSSINTCKSPEISVTDSPEKPKDIFKRPVDPVSLPNSKRPRLKLEEEERTREISSVMMTMSGYLSPAREGKLPEARPPTIISERHEKHKINSHHTNIMKGPPLPGLDKSERKSKKSKLLNGKVMKSKRKDKSHKGETSKSKDSKIDKHAGHSKSKDIHVPHHNHITMPAPKPLPPPKIMPPPQILDSLQPVIKQEPMDPIPTQITRNIPIGEDAIPVPRKIPISKSPLVSNSVPTNKYPPPGALLPDIPIKKEVIDEEEKLASQPDRSKINIFKRISNKSKEDKYSSEVPDKLHSENISTFVHNSSREVIKTENRSPDSLKFKPGEPVVNNNDNSAVDLSMQMDLTANEVINIDDDGPDINSLHPEHIAPYPALVPVKKSVPVYSKDIPTCSPKIKKERKHKEKKDKAAEKAAKLEAKLLKKQQQMAFEMAHNAERQLMGHFKTKAPKMNRPKNDAKMTHPSHLPPGFPYCAMGHVSGLMPGPGLIPTPGLIPSADILAGIANNPALRGLNTQNLIANPFAMSGPGLIPPNFLPGALGSGPLGNFGHASRAQPRNIPSMLRRPSLEVIPVNNDDSLMHKASTISPVREKVRHEKHKMSAIPNIIQKVKKPHKEHKSNVYKMPVITPDITIELNPPKTEPIRSEPVEKIPEIPAKIEPVISNEAPVLPPQLEPQLPKDKDQEKLEKKKDKSHKKEKKDKDGIKIKKKKDKKDKNKDKSEKKKEKEENKELKDRIKKEKKEKKKEKVTDGLVPKLTLKLGSASPMPPSSPDIFKLNIKPVIKKEEDDLPKEDPPSREHSRSPELAQISALVTRPPKQKNSSKHNHTNEVEPKSPTQSSSSPPRKNRPPSGNKYKRILFKPIAKKSMEHYEESDISTLAEEPPPKVETAGNPLPTPYYLDDHGNKIWVCPACGRPDNGSPMIGCDGCDGWYHWVCVGITEEPGAAEDWFCKSCVAKRAAMVFAGVTSGKKRGRKPKTEKVKDCH